MCETCGRTIKHGARVHLVNVSMCKSELYGLLNKDRPAQGDIYPTGWVHFAADLDEEFFRQLTAEQLVTRVVKGYRKQEWVKSRERNHDLDCSNYPRAAASVFGVDRFSEHRKQLRIRSATSPAPPISPER
jgi:phage terminase large subunit GpA-like protein